MPSQEPGAEKEQQRWLQWFVVYTFKNGTYTMTSDSSTKDHGTYAITKNSKTDPFK